MYAIIYKTLFGTKLNQNQLDKDTYLYISRMNIWHQIMSFD